MPGRKIVSVNPRVDWKPGDRVKYESKYARIAMLKKKSNGTILVKLLFDDGSATPWIFTGGIEREVR